MREFSEAEKKTYRRLRQAYRRAIHGVIRRRGHATEMRIACQRITDHAFKIGWLEAPCRLDTGPLIV